MKLVSVNVGQPRPYSYKEKQGMTSIFKSAVSGPKRVSFTNIEGDAQGDLAVHGGPLKAVYAYDVSYYDHWKNILEWQDWNYGLFGENLTTQGLTDDKVLVGSVYRIGSAYLKAIQPRFPCIKLNVRFGIDDMLQRFTKEGRNGTYFSVVQQGSIEAGDEISIEEISSHDISIQQLVHAYYNKGTDATTIDKILAIDFLPERLRKAFESFK
jgi:MOSC domain-containing protein YiiM